MNLKFEKNFTDLHVVTRHVMYARYPPDYSPREGVLTPQYLDYTMLAPTTLVPRHRSLLIQMLRQMFPANSLYVSKRDIQEWANENRFLPAFCMVFKSSCPKQKISLNYSAEQVPSRILLLSKCLLSLLMIGLSDSCKLVSISFFYFRLNRKLIQSISMSMAGLSISRVEGSGNSH